MKHLKAFIVSLWDGLSQMLFPSVCLCCEEQLLQSGQYICSFCLQKRFERPSTENSVGSSHSPILPENVLAQQALWKFDPGGKVQHLIHQLKYHRMAKVGIQLGAVLARRLKDLPAIQSAGRPADHQMILLPVPLHRLKFRKRGYNQAAYIARGIESVLNIPICSANAVIRKRNTRSQTGLSLQQRQENIKDAFRIKNPHEVAEKKVVIVDDVFTTGATAFELAKVLHQAGSESIVIWTIAQV
jgi:ComF family protein